MATSRLAGLRLLFLELSVALVLVALATSAALAQEVVWPTPEWPAAEPADVGLDATALNQARDYALSAGGSGMIVRNGRAVLRWGDQQQRYDIKSATKSFGATALAVAVMDGKVELDAPARQYHPTLGAPPESNLQTGWLDQITIFHLATQTAGFDKPGGYEKLLFPPGTRWHYSDGGPNWLAECITLVYRQDLQELMFERVFTPLDISRDDLTWRANQYREHTIEGIPRREFGAGVHANVEALSRLGYLYLHGGRWRDRQILPKSFVEIATRPIEAVVGLEEWDSQAHGNASDHYGLLWWNNGDGALTNVPRSAYWAWGLYDSLIVVIPPLNLVVVRAGARGRRLPRRDGADHYDVLAPLLDPIVAAAHWSRSDADAVSSASTESPASYPPSPVIAAIAWAPKESILRMAPGGDNWPMTWGGDDVLYTAYGDGNGFEPQVNEKLSLGLARVSGDPPNIHGENIRSASGERRGDGASGEKASGLLMIDDVLYMWVRNANNSQLAWSTDHGKTWTRCDWKWTVSFGCPTFLNFGKNYAGARDDYVYVYSADSETAYDPADRMVLARAPRNEIADRQAYEFFTNVDAAGVAQWTKDIRQRGPAFTHPRRCYRSAVTFNAPLKRYLWCQAYPESDDSRGPRFQGGLGIFDAPEPWGPWTTVFHTDRWDVGPGETNSIPTKWISEDGKTLYLAFSGNDCFSLRQARLTIAN